MSDIKNKTDLLKQVCFLFILGFSFSCKTNVEENQDSKIGFFNTDKDLLLANFDCKTDVDDLHSIAAFFTLMSNPKFATINYYGVAGAYGVQEGLYVPGNELFQLAFNDDWSDADTEFEKALIEVRDISIKYLTKGGDVWIAEAGQSDFSSSLIAALKIGLPTLDTKQRIHIVQHSNWNEKSTSSHSLNYAKENADYHKIPDGNAVGNGTPGFRSPEFRLNNSTIADPQVKKVWQLAVDLANHYNGKEGRYNNEAVSNGGLDFSDLSETCWILGLQNIKDVDEFFESYVH